VCLGPEVARFLAVHLKDALLKQAAYQEANITQALIDVLFELDAAVLDPVNQPELRRWASTSAWLLMSDRLEFSIY
jgi:hypothetical protein